MPTHCGLIDIFHIKGTVMQIKKTLTNDYLRVSKITSKFRIISHIFLVNYS